MDLTPASIEKLLYRLVIQFLIFSQGSNKLLDPHLNQIGKRLRNGANLNQLTPELQSISKTLLHISKQTKQDFQAEKNADSEQEQNNYILERLDELLSEVAVPQRFLQQTNSLKQRARLEQSGETYKKIIDSAVALLLDISGYGETEQQEVDNFLTGLTKELSQIEQQVEIAGQASRLSLENRDNLNSAMHRQVDSIKNAAMSAKELSTLQSHTGILLDRLMVQLVDYKRQDDALQKQANEQIEIMARKLQDLETETETLRTKLKIEHDRALSDSLTGLPNRLAYNTRIELEYNRWKRYKTPLSLAIWDIDHFKRINDTYGHKAGDKTLTLVGQLLSTNCRQTDFAARYGGEEFVMLMPSTRAEQAMEMAENIRKMIQGCGFNFNGEDIKLTLCCGISDFKEGDMLDDVFVRADQALYYCKQSGRNRCAIYRSDMNPD